MKNFERFIIYPLLLIQLLIIGCLFVVLRDDIHITDGDIKSIAVNELVVKNDLNEIIAMIGNIDEHGQISIRDKFGRLITLIGVDEENNQMKARIVVADHYEDYSLGEYYGVGGLKETEKYDN